MESRAKALGHPIHQMLIPFPFGLLSTAVVFDIIYLFTTTPSRANTFSTVSFWMIAAGIVGGLMAAAGSGWLCLLLWVELLGWYGRFLQL